MIKAAVVLVCNDEYWLPYALLASEGYFDRYVIYDVGSTDRTPDIIHWFAEKNKNKSEFFIRQFPTIPPPIVQGTFRNSQFAEARADWIFMLDADEIYSPQAYSEITTSAIYLEQGGRTLYGIVPRIEVCGDLSSAYGLDLSVSHHRFYHRTAVFCGPHPGEWPLVEQKHHNQVWIEGNPACYHFHNTERSSRDADVPKRIERRHKKTYHPGQAGVLDLFSELPILRNKIEDFPVNPVLALMQSK